ncbi:uncharacterized protein ACOB8E_015942 [Sarcophilus harrisii]
MPLGGDLFSHPLHSVPSGGRLLVALPGKGLVNHQVPRKGGSLFGCSQGSPGARAIQSGRRQARFSVPFLLGPPKQEAPGGLQCGSPTWKRIGIADEPGQALATQSPGKPLPKGQASAEGAGPRDWGDGKKRSKPGLERRWELWEWRRDLSRFSVCLGAGGVCSGDGLGEKRGQLWEARNGAAPRARGWGLSRGGYVTAAGGMCTGDAKARPGTRGPRERPQRTEGLEKPGQDRGRPRPRRSVWGLREQAPLGPGRRYAPINEKPTQASSV